MGEDERTIEYRRPDVKADEPRKGSFRLDLQPDRNLRSFWVLVLIAFALLVAVVALIEWLIRI